MARCNIHSVTGRLQPSNEKKMSDTLHHEQLRTGKVDERYQIMSYTLQTNVAHPTIDE